MHSQLAYLVEIHYICKTISWFVPLVIVLKEVQISNNIYLTIMKKLLSLAVMTMCFCLKIAAQEQPDSIVIRDAEGNYEEKTCYEYDKDGHQILQTTLKWDTEKKTWNNRNMYKRVYDDNGNESELIMYEGSGASWNEGWHYYYSYNEKGQMAEKVMDYRGKPDDKEVYSYDENGKEQAQIRYTYTDGRYVVRYIYEIFYDENGYEQEFRGSYYDGVNKTPFYKFVYTNDKNGNQLTYYALDYIDGEWVGSYGEMYEYNEAGLQVGYYDVSCVDGEWVKEDYYMATVYDANGNMTEEIEYNIVDGNKIASYICKYEYDESMRLICQKHYEGDSDTPYSTYTYYYGGNSTAIVPIAHSERMDTRKVMKNGKVHIVRANRTFDINGMECIK